MSGKEKCQEAEMDCNSYNALSLAVKAVVESEAALEKARLAVDAAEVTYSVANRKVQAAHHEYEKAQSRIYEEAKSACKNVLITKEKLLRSGEEYESARSVYFAAIETSRGFDNSQDPAFKEIKESYITAKDSYNALYDSASPEVRAEAGRAAGLRKS